MSYYQVYRRLRWRYCPGSWRLKRVGPLLFPPPVNVQQSMLSDLSLLKQESEDRVVESRPERLQVLPLVLPPEPERPASVSARERQLEAGQQDLSAPNLGLVRRDPDHSRSNRSFHVFTGPA